MTDQLGRTIGTGVVALGLLALSLSSPGETRDAGAAAPRPEEAAEAAADSAEQAAEDLRERSGDRLPAGSGMHAVIGRWGEESRRAAFSILEKYGPPDEVSEGRLVWNNTGSFRRTVVYKEELRRSFPSPRAEVLEQYVDYEVPYGRLGDLARFHDGVRADRTAGLLSARGPSEIDNFIALNLAHEVVTGKRGLTEARAAFASLSKEAEAGRPSPYGQGLLFRPRRAEKGIPGAPSAGLLP